MTLNFDLQIIKDFAEYKAEVKDNDELLIRNISKQVTFDLGQPYIDESPIKIVEHKNTEPTSTEKQSESISEIKEEVEDEEKNTSYHKEHKSSNFDVANDTKQSIEDERP